MLDTENQLSRLVAPEDYRAARAHIFPSPGSLAWFERRHKTKLLTAGAISRPAGRTMIDPTAYDQVVLAVGQAAARSAA